MRVLLMSCLVALCPSLAAAADRVPLDPPATPGSFAPQLATTADGVVLTWLEPVPGESSAAAGASRHRVRFSRLADGAWTAPVTLVESGNLFANWADMPGVAAAGDGALVAWWLERNGESPYAYGVRIVRSTDGGSTWTALGWLHDDVSPSEHGFVSMTVEASGTRAFWLDGRATLEGRPMTLRTALVGKSVAASALVDEAVCDCCSTAAVTLGDAALVAYRDRTADEIRDVRVAALVAGEPQRSTLAGDDGWRIEGCPVNGPALAAAGGRVAVGWFGAPGDRGHVAAAFSADAGATFSAPLVVDAAQPIGRVALAALPGGDFALAWHARAGDRAEIRIVRLNPGGAGAPYVLAATSGGRSSGFARLAALPDGGLLAVWTVAGEGPTRLRAARLGVEALPRP
jgi:hypothetical protein